MMTNHSTSAHTGTRSAIPVTVLFTAGCANAAPTVSLVRRTARELGIAIELSQLVLTSPEEAAQHLFYGSPTVRVNGLDIDPLIRGRQAFGFT